MPSTSNNNNNNNYNHRSSPPSYFFPHQFVSPAPAALPRQVDGVREALQEINIKKFEKQDDSKTTTSPPLPPPPSSSSDDWRLVVWNQKGALQNKHPMLERLEAVNPTFTVLLESGRALIEDYDKYFATKSRKEDMLNGFALHEVVQRLGYKIITAPPRYVEKKKGEPTKTPHYYIGGASLLIKDHVRCEEFVWKEGLEIIEKGEHFAEIACAKIHPPDAPPFILTGIYVHPSAIHRRVDLRNLFSDLLHAVPSNMIIAGDFNSQPPTYGEYSNTTTKFCGEVMYKAAVEKNLHLVHVDGPTTFKKNTDFSNWDGSGYNNDHILVGSDVMTSIVDAAEEAIPLLYDKLEHAYDPEINKDTSSSSVTGWCSDHIPLVWAFKLGNPKNTTNWRSSVRFDRASDGAKKQYNNRFQKLMQQARNSRDYKFKNVEAFLRLAAFECIPHSRPPKTPYNPRYWTKENEEKFNEEINETKQQDIAAQHKVLREIRETTATRLAVEDNDPASAWIFIRKVLGISKNSNSKITPPLIDPDDPSKEHKIIDKGERIEKLAEKFAEVSKNIKGKDNQQQLKNLAQEIIDSGLHTSSYNDLSLTELKVAIHNKKSNKCADFLGLKAEHIKALDEKSLTLLLPLFDRMFRLHDYPSHWKVAQVTAIPKARRDLSILKSWRPVSVIAILSRIAEDIVTSRIQHIFSKVCKGKSQFAYKRGVATDFPISGLSMFITDGQDQKAAPTFWDANNPNEALHPRFYPQNRHIPRTKEEIKESKHKHFGRSHCSLIVAIDASDAFCRAITAKAVRKLMEMGLHAEALWITQFLIGRSLYVRDGDIKSKTHMLERGVSQGTVLGPLLWALVIDDLLAELDAECAKHCPGVVAAGAHFADDLNFCLRGFNPTSLVFKANELMKIIKKWSVENDIPMSKLQATWINNTQRKVENFDGHTITFDENLSCKCGYEPIRILGVYFDYEFSFKYHVEQLLGSCEKSLNMLRAMKNYVHAQKLALLYEGTILSRLLFAVDAWYPYISDTNRAKIQTLHAQGCKIITGAAKTSHSSSVVFEAGLRDFDQIVLERNVRLADKLRRLPMPTIPKEEAAHGMDWFLRLFRMMPAPTASNRDHARPNNNAGIIKSPRKLFQKDINVLVNQRSKTLGLTLRDAGHDLILNGLDPKNNVNQLTRTLPSYPFAPHEMKIFEQQIKFFWTPPGDLVKPSEDIKNWPKELVEKFKNANQERLKELASSIFADSKTLWGYTDGSKFELDGSCAGGFVLFRGDDCDNKNLVTSGGGPAGELACVYSAELVAIHGLLQYLVNNITTLGTNKIVLVMDSQSAMRAFEVSWIRRMNTVEQHICRLLFTLASYGIKIHMGFVFSHLGVIGNEKADDQANQAREIFKNTSPFLGYTDFDTSREHLKTLFKSHDPLAAYTKYENCTSVQTLAIRKIQGRQSKAFRFREAPNSSPSPRIPAGTISRLSEKNLYSARVGVLPAVGGHSAFDNNNSSEECPMCGEQFTLGRDGTTIEHLFYSCNGTISLRNKYKIASTTMMWKTDEETITNVTSFLDDVVAQCLQQRQLNDNNNNNNFSLDNNINNSPSNQSPLDFDSETSQ